jgi:hypothetical protein
VRVRVDDKAMRAIGGLVLLGLPGLVLGAAVGVVVRRWMLLLVFAGLGLAAFAYGISHVPDGPDDDDPGILVAIAVITNSSAGWRARRSASCCVDPCIATPLSRKRTRVGGSLFLRAAGSTSPLLGCPAR